MAGFSSIVTQISIVTSAGVALQNAQEATAAAAAAAVVREAAAVGGGWTCWRARAQEEKRLQGWPLPRSCSMRKVIRCGQSLQTCRNLTQYSSFSGIPFWDLMSECKTSAWDWLQRAVGAGEQQWREQRARGLHGPRAQRDRPPQRRAGQPRLRLHDLPARQRQGAPTFSSAAGPLWAPLDCYVPASCWPCLYAHAVV